MNAQSTEPSPIDPKDPLRRAIRWSPSQVDAELRAIGTHRTYRRGSYLMRQGDRTDYALLILCGQVKVVAVGTEGHSRLLGIRGAGEIVGECAAVTEKPRIASVVALEHVSAHVVPGEVFRALVAQQNSLAVQLLRTAIARQAESDQRLLDASGYDVLHRVCRLLAEIGEQRPHRADGPLIVPLTQQEIAEAVGASREACANALRRMRAAGLVQTGYRAVHLLDLPALYDFETQDPATLQALSGETTARRSAARRRAAPGSTPKSASARIPPPTNAQQYTDTRERLV